MKHMSYLCFVFILLFFVVDIVFSHYKYKKIKKRISKNCLKPHPIRHHDFIPNCCEHHFWNGQEYSMFFNNLGRRDEKIRNVPLSVSKPRMVIVGDSFTEGPQNWEDTFVGKISKKMPHLDFVNAGVRGYGPSTYFLLVKSLLLDDRLKFDEVLVFIDVGDIHNEATYYKDNSDGLIETLTEPKDPIYSHYGAMREKIKTKLLIMNTLITNIEKLLVMLGFYSLPTKSRGNVFDDPMSAWTYKLQNELDFYPPKGYLPLGVQGGIDKALKKMNLLKDLLEESGIPLSIAVYPWPAQLSHNDFNSRQVALWKQWAETAKCKRFLNFFPDFFSEKEKCNRLLPGYWYEMLFIFGDVHYNSNGNEIISRRLEKEFAATPIKKINASKNPKDVNG